jgi:hypothetical protein
MVFVFIMSEIRSEIQKLNWTFHALLNILQAYLYALETYVNLGNMYLELFLHRYLRWAGHVARMG